MVFVQGMVCYCFCFGGLPPLWSPKILHSVPGAFHESNLTAAGAAMFVMSPS